MTPVTVHLSELHAACRRPENLNLYASLMLGDLFKAEFSETHQAYWALLAENALSGQEPELYYALGLPRGFAKTTMMKLFATWLFAYTDFQFCLIVSSTATKAEFVVADICGIMDTQNYRALYGNWRQAQEKDSTETKIFHFNGKDCVISSIGAEGSVRGLNIKNLRPDAILLEDAQDRECALSPVRNTAFLDWFLGTLLKAKSNRRAFVCFIGNMYNTECALHQLSKNQYWISLISSGLLADGESLWPEYRTKESLLREFEHDSSLQKGHLFLAEVMNDPHALSNNWFDSSLLKPYQFSLDELPNASFIIVDPALGKAGSDNTAIGLVQLIEGKAVLRAVDAGKYGDEETVKRALALAIQSRACLIVVEAVAYQATLCNYFDRTLRKKHITGIRVEGITPGGRSKNSRISDATKKWLKQEIDVHPEARPAVLAELTIWNPLKKNNKDDILDLLAYSDKALQEYWHILYESAELESGQPVTQVASVVETNCF